MRIFKKLYQCSIDFFSVIRHLRYHAELLMSSVGFSDKTDKTFLDSIKFMIICYSASCGGDFSKINLIHSDSFPCIDVDKNLIKHEYWNIHDNWSNFCRALEDFNTLEQQENVGNVDIDFEKLSGWQKTKVTTWALLNFKKMERLMESMSGVENFRYEMKINEIPNLITQIFERDYSAICEAGREAESENIFNPERVCDRFWPILRHAS